GVSPPPPVSSPGNHPGDVPGPPPDDVFPCVSGATGTSPIIIHNIHSAPSSTRQPAGALSSGSSCGSATASRGGGSASTETAMKSAPARSGAASARATATAANSPAQRAGVMLRVMYGLLAV